MFFVLNVGRSGSRTIAQVLSQSPTCRCLHEPKPLLLEQLYGYRAGTVPHDDLVAALRASRHEAEGEVYGESSNRLAIGVPALRDAFPGAGYLWLVRDGRAMVSSAVQRGWYGPDEPDNDWSRNRPTGPLLGDMTEGEWLALDQFERVCWYWDRVNRLIRDEASTAQPLLVRLEELDDQLPAIVDHLGLQPAAFTVTRANRRYGAGETPPPGAKRSNRVEHVFEPANWSSEQRDRFDRRCGELMDELYPGWRTTPADAWSRSGGRGDDVGEVLAAIREEIAEAAVRADEVRDAQRERRAVEDTLQRVRDDNERLQTRVEQADAATAAARDAMDALRTDVDAMRSQLDAREVRVAQAEQLAPALEAVRGERDRLEAELHALRDRVVDLDRQLGRERTRRERIESMRAYRSARRIGDARGRVRARLLDVPRLLLRRLPARLAQGLRDRVQRLRRRSGLQAVLLPTHAADRLIDVPVGDGRCAPAPTVVVLAMEVGDAELEMLLRGLRELQVRLRFAPLLVTDSGAFPRLRDARVLFEYVPPRDGWERGEPGASYDGFVTSRVAELVEVYRPDIVVPVDLRPRTAAASLAGLRAAVEDVAARHAHMTAAAELA